MKLLIALIAVAVLMPWPLLLTQDHWWAFIVDTAAIMVVLRLVFGQEWANRAGLRLPPKHALLAVATFVVVLIGTKILLPIAYEAAALTVHAPNLKDQVGFTFQSLNEEIFFRALLIGFFIQYVRSVPLVSFGLAFLFAAAHYFMYRFTNPMHFALSTSTLATLFLAGVTMNNLYLAFRHIGFSWSLHAGWNVVWLPATFFDAATNERLHEPQIFDRVLGSPLIVAAACAITILSFMLVVRRAWMRKIELMETDRLILRRWRDSDLEPFAAKGADPKVMEYFPALLSRDESAALIARIEERFQSNGFCFWALERKSGGAFLGFVGLNRPTFNAPFMPCVEVGWRLASDHWGQGYATEAAQASLRYAFDNLGIGGVVAFTASGNERSRKVMNRLGMTYDPTGDFDHPAFPDGHTLKRHVLYRSQCSDDGQ